jgi:hypothetical protein
MAPLARLIDGRQDDHNARCGKRRSGPHSPFLQPGFQRGLRHGSLDNGNDNIVKPVILPQVQCIAAPLEQ